MPLGAWIEVRGFIACCCAVALRTFFHQPSRMNTPFLIYGVSDTFARDSREHLFSCGRTRMLLATMSLMHTHTHTPYMATLKGAGMHYLIHPYPLAGELPPGIPRELPRAVRKQHATKPE